MKVNKERVVSSNIIFIYTSVIWCNFLYTVNPLFKHTLGNTSECA